jgi:hypothetical protein
MSIAKKAAAAAFFIGLAAAHAQDAVPRPQVKPGDSWTYRRTDHLEKREAILKVEVTFANDKAIHVVQTDAAGDKETDATATSEWNMVASPRDGFFTPHTGLFRFPLRPGASWKSSYTVRFPRQDLEARHERTVTVAGWEDVRVPAGRFHALKVVSAGTVQRSDRPRPGTVTETVWYVPEVRRFVKWTFESGNARVGVVQSWEFELMGYRLQP